MVQGFAVLVVGGAALAVVLYLLVRAVGGIAAKEATGWMPYLSVGLIRRASRRLPEEHRERWVAEMEADVREFADRPVSGLVHAILAARGARRLAGELTPVSIASGIDGSEREVTHRFGTARLSTWATAVFTRVALFGSAGKRLSAKVVRWTLPSRLGSRFAKLGGSSGPTLPRSTMKAFAVGAASVFSPFLEELGRSLKRVYIGLELVSRMILTSARSVRAYLEYLIGPR
jgi:hypothetical protein